MALGLAGIDVGLGPSLLGLLAFVVLLLLPGLLVVRAPWPAVPFLSLAFWVLSWGWLFGASREPFLRGALLGFFLLVLLRLLKPLDGRRPGWPTVLVLIAAALPLLAFFLWPLCPGAEMSFHSLGARLVVWRDGLPATYEPLAPMRPFGAHAPALPALAADVSLLSGLPAAKSVLLVHQAALGLLLIGLFALLIRRLAGRRHVPGRLGPGPAGARPGRRPGSRPAAPALEGRPRADPARPGDRRCPGPGRPVVVASRPGRLGR